MRGLVLIIAVVAAMAGAPAHAQRIRPAVRPPPPETSHPFQPPSTADAFQRQNQALYDMRMQSCNGSPSCESEVRTSIMADQLRATVRPDPQRFERHDR